MIRLSIRALAATAVIARSERPKLRMPMAGVRGRFSRGSWLVAAGLALSITGCGGGSASPAGATSPATVFVTADAAQLVLKAGDVGSGWLVVPDQTHDVSLQDAEKGDPPAIKKLEEGSYRSGYQGLYIDSNRAQHNGVLVGAFTFQSQTVALQVADAWSTHSAKDLKNAELLHPPSDAPGDHISGWKGEAPQNGKMVPMCFVLWSHGNAVGGIFLFGKNASEQRLYRLAATEDHKLTSAV